MEKIDFTLLADGSSDKTLIYPLKWLLRREAGDVPINESVADLSRLVRPPNKLSAKIEKAVELYPCDLLFIHRDSERQSAQLRYDEIKNAIDSLKQRKPDFNIPYICIVPITMTEAWLLFDESVIRKAAGNPAGENPISMPRIGKTEEIADPKSMLFTLLKDSCGLRGRQKSNLNPAKCRHLVAQYITDFSPLLKLKAFLRLRDEIKAVLYRLQ